MPKNATRLIPLLLALGLTACGGGALADANLPPVEDPTQTPPPPSEPPPPGASTLDDQLVPLLAGAGLTPPPPPLSPSPELFALGRALFFDKILSGNRNIACATCHHPTAATGDDLSVSIGQGGRGTASTRQLAAGTLVPRNAPPLFNRGLPGVTRMFWDSRVRLRGGAGQPRLLQTPEPALNGANPSAGEIAGLLDTALAAQALFPLLSEAEMRGAAGENEIADASSNLAAWALLVARLVGTDNGTVGGVAAYRTLFQRAFPQIVDFDQLHIGHVGRAIGVYEATAFQAMHSPLDAYVGGDVTALTEEAKRGALLFFGRADCRRCHGGPLFTDNAHHAIAIPQVGPGRDVPFEDVGREAVTGDPDDRYRFRTPSLRNVALTGPWMHDGAYTSLEAAIGHYDDPVRRLLDYDANQLAPLLRNLVDRDATRNQARADALSGILRPSPNLNGGEVAALAAFLRALTDPASVDLTAEIPDSVPSGLPVDD